MPWSVIENVPPIANEIQRINPARMIDLGVGLGLYGVIARQLLDGIHGRFDADSWEHVINGIEAFGSYQNPSWGVYNWIDIADFTEAPSPIVGYDLVLMLDSFEHLSPELGRAFLQRLLRENRHVLLSVPNGPCVQEKAVHGNEFEKHRATYWPNSFDEYGGKVLHLGYCMVVSIPGRA